MITAAGGAGIGCNGGNGMRVGAMVLTLASSPRVCGCLKRLLPSDSMTSHWKARKVWKRSTHFARAFHAVKDSWTVVIMRSSNEDFGTEGSYTRLGTAFWIECQAPRSRTFRSGEFGGWQ